MKAMPLLTIRRVRPLWHAFNVSAHERKYNVIMSDSDKQKHPFHNLFDGLEKMVDLAQQLKDLEEKGGKTGQGEVDLGNVRKGMKAMYGFSINTMSGGKPDIQTFGNVRKTTEGPKVDDEREPVVDILEEGDQMLIFVEMPGVSESDIKTELSEDILELVADNGNRKYRKEIHLPHKADPASMKSQYNNGIFEMRLSKASA